jgi:NADH-quinone oxidoreductase subunit M
MTLIQEDMKSLVAYSSVSHLGFVMLGLVAMNIIGVTGSLLQQINHGISTGALFLLIGIVYERRHTRMIADYGGLFALAPVFTIAFLIVGLSSIGLPGTNGFVGEFLILLGAFAASPFWAIVATIGIVLAAGYILWMVMRVFFGPVTNAANEAIRDLTGRELATVIPLVVLIFWIGVFPSPFLKRIEPDLQKWLELAHPAHLIENQVREHPCYVLLEPTRPAGEGTR